MQSVIAVLSTNLFKTVTRSGASMLYFTRPFHLTSQHSEGLHICPETDLLSLCTHGIDA
ncbi:uncharacterized protein RCC_02589 [Ramularia collo-cygni]|uniref:Uncharacterized protein n=1 Tax=Ramularia collo-cygni TaxID=112498 RepID=A0A2D3V2N8_9PEZI|nr:uncharacterized protein RCC_02589 [Ramularia collo-cygni]CZT16754.1 uncharacterized protein RCC_02589 [Ramularia collo-cygni]